MSQPAFGEAGQDRDRLSPVRGKDGRGAPQVTSTTFCNTPDTLGDVWKPVGPLPASVYWRRRCLAAVTAVAMLLALAWTGAVLIAPDDQGPRDAASAGLSGVEPAAAASTVREPGAAPAVADGTRTAADATDPTGMTSERIQPDGKPRATSPLPAPHPVPPTGPVPCTNEMLGVTAEIDAPEHRVGERPVLRLVIENVADEPCVRDLDSQRQEIVVWSEDLSERLWSSNDCVNAPSTDLRTLVPGQPVAFSVRWAGRTTTPGCAEERTVVPAGSYQVMTRLDDVISPPTPFQRLP